jgi:hypothetical protein
MVVRQAGVGHVIVVPPERIEQGGEEYDGAKHHDKRRKNIHDRPSKQDVSLASLEGKIASGRGGQNEEKRICI